MESAKYRILAVENETLIALEIEDALEALGCEIVGSASTAQRALEYARRPEPLDCVILDVTVRDGKSYPVAEVLRERPVGLVVPR